MARADLGTGCRHCEQHLPVEDRVRKIYARGLCHKCYDDPAIFARYPTLSGRTGTGTGTTEPSDNPLFVWWRQMIAGKGKGRPLPAQPTQAIPGSTQKVRVMRQRWLNGEQLYHPLDATLGEGVVPPVEHPEVEQQCRSEL